MLQRIQVIYKGNVQGVGFRYTARSVAQRYSVSGFVKNLTNGDVEVTAEGHQAQVEQFVADLEREMQGYVDSRTVEWGAPTGEFRGFTVRF